MQGEFSERELNSLRFHENRYQGTAQRPVNNMTEEVPVPDTLLLGLLSKSTRRHKSIGNQTPEVPVILKLPIFKQGFCRKVPPLAQV